MSPGPEFVADALAAPTATAVRRRVFRQLVSSLVFEGVLEGVLHGDGVVRARAADGTPVTYRFSARRAHGFSRVRLSDAPVTRQVGGAPEEEACSLTTFLRESRVAVEPHLSRVATELERTVVHDALAEHARTVRGDTLAGADHDALEGLVTDGHRYHPAYKSRVGFSVADDLAYSPEFLPAVRPLWLAGAGDVASLTPSVREATSITAPPAPISVPAGYTALPVHPWQWHNVIVHRFADLLADGRLIVLGEDPHAFTPTQSVRTLACRDDPARPTVKCALDIVNTSTSRGLAPHTVRNAAPISAWLGGIVSRDPLLTERVVLQREVAGVSVAGSGSLGCLWREPLRVPAGEAAVPGTALHARERDGTPMILPWLRAHGTRGWVDAFASAVVVPLVHLLVRHGVALETHAQNMSLCHRDGLPVRVALKDFHDGVRFRRARLADPAAAPPLESPPADHPNANSFLETDDDAAVVGFLLDAVLAVNVGELALLLDEEGLLPEPAFWAIVGRVLREHHASLDERPRYDVFVETFPMEKLTTRRLGADTALAVHAVPNPLR